MQASGTGLEQNRRYAECCFPTKLNQPKAREVLGKLARVYDHLGLVSPMTLQGKMIFREACESKISWDAPLPDKLAKLWDSWESRLPARVSTRRSVATYRESVTLWNFMHLEMRVGVV